MTKRHLPMTARLPLLLLALLSLVLFARAHRSEAAPLLQATNRVTNPGFEQPYNSGVANGWAPWHQDTGKTTCDTRYLVQPKWFNELNPSIVLEGGSSQGVGNQFDTWRGGVFQTVTGLTTGATYRFTVSARLFASNENFGTAPADGIGVVRVGIDPNGSGLWSDGDIKWSNVIAPAGAWQSVSVEATATAGQISVFTEVDYGGANNCRAHLDSWVDRAELIEVSAAGGQPPAPVPGNTPAPAPNPAPVVIVTLGPTPTPDAEGVIYMAVPPGGSLWTVAAQAGISLDELLEYNNLTRDSFVQAGQLLVVGFAEPSGSEATPTAEPETQGGSADEPAPEATATAEVTPTPAPPTAAPGGEICVNAFGDTNGNGQHETSEGFMAGVTFTLSQGSDVLGQGVSRGAAESVCFENIPAGSYEVAQILPASLEATTASNLSLDLSVGQQIGLEFGSRVRQETPAENAIAGAATEAPAATAVPTDSGGSGLSFGAISGLLLIVVAVLVLGGLILVVMRQRG